MAKEASSKVKPRTRAKTPVVSARTKRQPASAVATSAATAKSVLTALLALGNASAAQFATRFFKTGEGEYGAGDKFLGIRVPVLRKVARDFQDVGLEVALPLLKSS